MKYNKSIRAGFTLYEMLVCLAIISIIAGIAFYSNKQFKTDIEISNLAYKMALEVRQAQVDSVSVRQFTDISGQQSFSVPYGIHFSKSNPNSFILFADADGDGLYTNSSGDEFECDTSVGSECVEMVTIGRNNSIKGWCGFLWSNTSATCFYNGVGNDKQYLDIAFKRPDPDARFKAYDSLYAEKGEMGPVCNDSSNNVECTGWAICLTSPQGREKRVVVYNTGQISVENTQKTDPICGN